MKKILSILLILAMALSFTVMAFAEEKKDDPDLKTFLSELAEKDKVTEEDLSERRRTRSQKKICLNC